MSQSSETDRWVELQLTTPSGKMMFVCRSCGRQSVTPDKECPSPARVASGGSDPDIYVPCHMWPMEPRKWLEVQKHLEDKNCVFSGTVTLGDGVTVEVTIPLSEEEANEFVALHAELLLKKARDEKRAEAAKIGRLTPSEQEREFMRSLLEKQQQDNKMLKQAAGPPGPSAIKRGRLPPWSSRTSRSQVGSLEELLGSMGASVDPQVGVPKVFKDYVKEHIPDLLYDDPKQNT